MKEDVWEEYITVDIKSNEIVTNINYKICGFEATTNYQFRRDIKQKFYFFLLQIMSHNYFFLLSFGMEIIHSYKFTSLNIFL